MSATFLHFAKARWSFPFDTTRSTGAAIVILASLHIILIIMSRPDEEAQNLTADDFEYRSDEEQDDTSRPARPTRPSPQTFKSQYSIQTSERLKGVANRIIFSRYYILFYFIMMSLSLTTVVLSLVATRTSPSFRGTSLPGSER